MLDMYSDFTMLQAQTGMDIEILEMSDLDYYLKSVTEKEIQEKLWQIQDFLKSLGILLQILWQKTFTRAATLVSQSCICSGENGT